MYVSFDVGGSTLKAAAADTLDSPIFAIEPIHRAVTGNFGKDIGRLITMAYYATGSEPIEAVGIGVAGNPNTDRTAVDSARNLRHWEGRPLKSCLEGILRCPVFYDDDATAGALGQAYWGSSGKKNFHYIINGTGVGGKAVRDNRGRPEVLDLEWYQHFEAWENASGGRRLAEKYRKQPQQFTVREWRLVADVFRTQLDEYVQAYKSPAIVLAGNVAIRCAQTLVDSGEDLAPKITVTEFTTGDPATGVFSDNSGLMGGFGLIRRELHT